ncbi:MAG TPA: NADH pyrophosphatase zinc ribbon domain-containing protein, partial [Arthrobacter sp.]|nr:NADH pyrophosphatase zinc ribbon domain-containing protein [Arthrobacter sp.]
MSLAESPASNHQAQAGTSVSPHTGPAANHLLDTVLPVRPALIDRGSAARLKPGMLEELLTSGAARAMVLSGRQALINGSSLVLLDAAELARHLQDTAYAPEQLIYLGSALPGSDLAAGTELVLFLLPQQFEVQAEEFEAHIAGIPEGAQWAGFRDVAATLNPTDTAIFIEASAIANWHATHTHCPRCGTATAPEAGGWVRRCPADGS